MSEFDFCACFKKLGQPYQAHFRVFVLHFVILHIEKWNAKKKKKGLLTSKRNKALHYSA